MIFDKLSHAQTYDTLSSRIQQGLAYLQNTDLASLAPEKYEIDGDNLFVLIQEYETRPLENGKWESHKKYLDIQYIIEGNELMGYAPIEYLTDVVDLTPTKDMLYYKDANNAGIFLKLNAGEFALFFPQDAHMPNITNGTVCKNKKAVVKILID